MQHQRRKKPCGPTAFADPQHCSTPCPVLGWPFGQTSSYNFWWNQGEEEATFPTVTATVRRASLKLSSLTMWREPAWEWSQNKGKHCWEWRKTESRRLDPAKSEAGTTCSFRCQEPMGVQLHPHQYLFSLNHFELILSIEWKESYIS